MLLHGTVLAQLLIIMTLLKPDYRPARLRETSSRWYIELYCPHRKRPTFDLNRIVNLEARRKRGYELCELLNWWVQAGLQLSRFKETEARRRMIEAQRTSIAPRGHTDCRRALLYGVELKEALLRNPDSNRSYKSHSGIFIDFLEAQGWEMMPIDELRRHHVMAFLDHRRITDKVRNNTLNNNITTLNAIFTVLIDRGFLIDNPCQKIKKLPPEPKFRRPFTETEARAIMPFIYEEDPLLCLAVLMQYCCYMRPKAIYNCRRGYIDLDAGIIHLPAGGHKTGRLTGDAYKTIPTDFLPYFRELVPDVPARFFLFGQGYVPGGKKQCQGDRLYKRHKRMLKIAIERGIIHDDTGLTYYSWKDTGMTEDADKFPLVAIQQQAGHTSPVMTMKYVKTPKVNKHLRTKTNTVLPKKEAPPE